MPVDKNPALPLSSPIKSSFMNGIKGLPKYPTAIFPSILYKFINYICNTQRREVIKNIIPRISFMIGMIGFDVLNLS